MIDERKIRVAPPSIEASRVNGLVSVSAGGPSTTPVKIKPIADHLGSLTSVPPFSFWGARVDNTRCSTTPPVISSVCLGM